MCRSAWKMKVHEEMTGRSARDLLASRNAVIDLGPIVDAISGVTASLRASSFHRSRTGISARFCAPLRNQASSEGDVRQPLDDLSARLSVSQPLMELGIKQALVVEKARAEPQDDVAPSLLRWARRRNRCFIEKPGRRFATWPNLGQAPAQSTRPLGIVL